MREKKNKFWGKRNWGQSYQLLRTGRTTSTQKTRLYDTSAEKFQQAKGLSRWAEIQNMKEASKILNYLTEKGIATQEELEQRSILTYGQRVQLVGDLNKLQRQIETVTDTIKLVKKYKKYKPFYDAYQSATFRKKYEKEHKQELNSFQMLNRSKRADLASENCCKLCLCSFSYFFRNVAL